LGARCFVNTACLDLVALDLRHHRGGDRTLVIDAAADQVLHRRSGAAIGNMGDVHADRRIEQHAGEMDRGTCARRGELHSLLIGLRISDELRQVGDRQISARDQHDRLLDHQHDRGEIGGGVVERTLVERLALRMGA
jgi:hypothetical protein